jgi:hypothetical protein
MSLEQHMHPGERRPYRIELLADVLRGNACAGQSIEVSAGTASTLPAGLSVEEHLQSFRLEYEVSSQ